MIILSENKICEECGRKESNYKLINSKKFNKVLCEKCYSKYTRNNKGSNKFRVCEYCGKTSKETRIIKSRKYNKTLCERHYNLYRSTGELRRTENDPNKIIRKDDYALIELYNNNLKVNGYAKIDLEDIEKVKNYKWHLNKKENINYCYSSKFSLHRLIMGTINSKRSVYIDHINNDGLDCRKSNMRIVNNSENQANSKLPKNNTSGYKGVYKKRDKWVAEIKVNNNKIYLGSFNNKVDAILTRKKAEEKYFKEFRNNNDKYLEKFLKEEID